MTVLIPYADAVAGEPSHECDNCERKISVWPIPWQLAWPVNRGHYCSDCYFEWKSANAD